MLDYLAEVRAVLREYPPQQKAPRRIITDYDPNTGEESRSRGSSRGGYKRTYKLREGWQIKVNPDGSTGFLINPVKYAVHVQGPRRNGQRAIMRQKGWISITDAARLTRRRYTQIMNRAVKGGIA